jgi:hypothetical protein
LLHLLDPHNDLVELKDAVRLVGGCEKKEGDGMEWNTEEVMKGAREG